MSETDRVAVVSHGPGNELNKLFHSREHTVLKPIPLYEPQEDTLPSGLMESMRKSRPLVLIEENNENIFVADPADPVNPPVGHVAGVKCWTDFACRPRVFEIQVLSLERIDHIPLHN